MRLAGVHGAGVVDLLGASWWVPSAASGALGALRFPLGPQRLLEHVRDALATPALVVDGLLTNDKFCFTRHDRLKLRPPRRGYPSRENASRGGNRETKLDRSSHHEGSQRRRSALGSGISAPAPVGGSGAAGGPDGGGE